MDQLFEVLKYTVPGAIVLLATILTVSRFLENEEDKRALEAKKMSKKQILPLRLQAYERLTVFLERLKPSSIVHRVRKPDMTSRELHLALISAIRSEFEHNVAQQIYVSTEAWSMIVIVKDEFLKVLNLVSASLPKTATGRDLSKAIFEYFMKTKTPLPTQKAIDVLKKEVSYLY